MENWIVELTPDSYDSREEHVPVGVWRLLRHGTGLVLSRFQSNTYKDTVPLAASHYYDISKADDYMSIRRMIANNIYKEIIRLRVAAGHDDIKYQHVDFSR